MIVCSKKLRVQQHTEGQCRRINLTLLIVCTLFFVIIFSSCSLGPEGPPPPPPEYVCPTMTANPVILKMVYDSTEQAWIDTAVKDFNRQRYTACDGPITVQATPMDLGQSMQRILDGKLQPDIWNPGGSAWLSLLNTQWHSKNGKDLVDTTNTSSLISSPIVIAMWASEAKAMGWPVAASIRWSDIANLISDPRGWGSYKHPSWGKFKFGNTSLDYSNAGLEAAIGMSYAATCNENATAIATVTPTTSDTSSTCKKTGLTVDDVNSNGVKSFITNIEKSAIYYDSTTTTLADQMFRRGPTYLNAVAVEENLVIQANDKTKYPNLPEPVVAIYPKDGTIVSDYPFAILHGNWLSPSKNAASLVFRDFLLTRSEQAKAVQDGFRPNSQVGLGATTDVDHGIDPALPGTAFSIPDPNVVQTIQTNWAQERRPFDVMLLVDASSGMNFSIDNIPKIDGAKTGLKTFVDFMKDSDQLGLAAFFNDHIDTFSSLTLLGSKRQDILSRINSIPADGGVLLFDAIAQQFQQLQQLPSTSIRAMIVLSNKADTESTTSAGQLLSLITPPADQDSKQNIRIFTIAYGSEADVNMLTQIAQRTTGQEFSATPQNIQDVYQQIGELL